MSGFDPGPGWREVTDSEYRHSLGQPRLLSTDGSQGQGTRYWVREAPVPPLPTAPYTVIRVTSTSGMKSILIRNELGWYEIDDMSAPVEQPKTGWSFEVLSEPRAVTAKAVLDDPRIKDCPSETTLAQIAHEFGVQS